VRSSPKKAWHEWVTTVVAALALAIVARSFVLEPFIVDGHSMQNTLANHERLLVDRLSPEFAPLRDGEIVVFQPPLKTREDFVKRIVATGGQTVALSDGGLYVDGQPVAQPYLLRHGASTRDHCTMSPLRVPQGEIYVLGDNRANSEDSRIFGPVRLSAVRGVAFFAIWPFSRLGPLR